MKKINTISGSNKFMLCALCIALFCSQTLYGQWQSSTNYHADFTQGNGSSEYISMNTPSISGAFTLETWVQTKNRSCSANNKPQTNDAFISIADHSGDHGGNFSGAELGANSCDNSFDNVAGGASCKWYFAVGSGSNKAIVNSTITPSCNTWYHVAGVYTGSQIKFYINGNLQGTTNYTGSITFPTGSGGMKLGKEAANPSSQEGYLDGKLDNVAIWNTAKTYSSNPSDPDYYGNAISPTATGLVDHYHFNQNDRTKTDPVKDAASTSNDGSQGQDGGSSTAFVDYVGTGSGGPPLPVELLNFELVQNNESVDLFWSTATELNNYFFTLEKSMDGLHWNLLGTVEGNGTTNEISDYTYTDYNPYPIKTFYRLAQTDYDGKFEYLAIKSTNSNDGISQMSVRPNPSSNFVNIDYVQFPYSQIRFLNAQGIDVTEEINVLRNTGNSLTLDISAIQNGVYSVVSPTSSALLIKL